jgi:polynucleotide 5'-kinase involved in rRNA processing
MVTTMKEKDIKSTISEGMQDYFSSQSCETQIEKMMEHAIEKVFNKLSIDIAHVGGEVKDGKWAPSRINSLIHWGIKTQNRCTTFLDRAWLVLTGIVVTCTFTIIGYGLIHVIGTNIDKLN